MKAKYTLMDGFTEMTSAVNAGLRFFFPLPLPAEKIEASIGFKSTMPVRKELSNMKILVAEDDKINFLVINFLLKEKVKKVDRAINGKEAVELARINEYDLIFMDMNMPIMGGIEATRIIRGMHPGLPIIAQTAFTGPAEKAKFLAAGCDDVLFKPIKSELLLNLLIKYGTN